jgi:hypothetical protein
LLLTELDGYAMALQALLLEPAAFKLGKTGELEMGDGVRTCCEDRRLAIRSIATCLLHPLNDPLTDEAVRFMAAETNEERKMIVHLLEARIRQAWEEAHEDASKEFEPRSATDNTALKDLVAEMLERHIKRSQSVRDQDSSQKAVRLLRFRESCWDLDRIYYYLLVHYFGTAALRWESGADHRAKSEDYDLPCAVRDVELEVERYRARSKGGSLMPLTYGLMALSMLCSISIPEDTAKRTEVHDAIETAFTSVEKLEVLKSEPGYPIERLLGEIRQRLSPESKPSTPL